MASETSSAVSGAKLSYAKAVGSKPVPKISTPSVRKFPNTSPPVEAKDDQNTEVPSISPSAKKQPTSPDANGQGKEDAVSALISNMDRLKCQWMSAVRKSEQEAPRNALASLVGKPVPDGVTVRFLYWTEDYYTCKCESEEELDECYGDCPGAVWAGEPMFEVQLNGRAAYTDDRRMPWQGEHADYAALVDQELRKPETNRLAQMCAKRLAKC